LLRKLFAAVVATTTLALMGAASASAQPQNGLVNIRIADNVVQVPIGIAANVCDVNAAVLVNTFLDAAEPCRADATSTAGVFVESPNGTAPGAQTGLINLDISGNTVQIPLAAALNVCDVNVAVLVDLLFDDAATCEARARGRANSRMM
jgi:hypothetical protein